MKSPYLLILLSLFFSSLFCNASIIVETDDNSNRDVSLTRRDPSGPGPRRVILTNVTACYNTQELVISTTDYAGYVEIVISGFDDFSYTYFTSDIHSDIHSEIIPINMLSQGNYVLTIYTNFDTYTGDLEL